MEIIIRFDNFDFEGFLSEVTNNLSNHLSPEGIAEIVENGRPMGEEDTVLSAGDCRSHLQNVGAQLYFSFAVSDLEAGVHCADGEYRVFAEEPDEETGEEPNNSESNSQTGDTQDIGYLFTRRDDQLLIQSAYRFMGGCPVPRPWVESLGDEDVLPFYGKAMERFARRYVTE